MPDGTRFAQPLDDALAPPPDVHTTDDTNEIFDRLLRPFTTMMSQGHLGFLYDRWKQHPAARPGNGWSEQPMYGNGHQERRDGLLGKLMVINWGHIWEARGRLNNLHTAAGALDGSADQIFQNIHAAWTSKAGDAAAGTFTELRTASQTFADELQQLAAAVEGAWRTTRHAVRELACFADKPDGGKPMVDRYSSLGGGEGHGAEVRRDLSWYLDEMDNDLEVGHTSVEELRAPGGWKLWPGHGLKDRWANEICNELDDFCERYFLTIGTFRRRIEETVAEVERQWDALNTAATQLPGDPFGELSLPVPGSGPPPREHEPAGPPPRREEPTAPVSGPDPGIVEPPPRPQQAPDDTTIPSGVLPGEPPGTEQRQPEAGRPRTIEITDGDRKISVQSPDGAGHVTITIDDGSGPPKSYDLDFSAALGTETDAAEPRPEPDRRPELDHRQDRQQDRDLSAADRPVEQPVRAGQDGRCVIQDGPLTVTAEQPAVAPSSIVLTVDNGTGEPTTYTLDYSASSDDQATSTQAFTAGGQQYESASGFGGTSSPEAGPLGSTGAAAGNPGEAGLAVADDQPARSSHGAVSDHSGAAAGAAAGVPMFAGLGAGTADDSAERAASGWRLQGDLFDGDLEAEHGSASAAIGGEGGDRR